MQPKTCELCGKDYITETCNGCVGSLVCTHTGCTKLQGEDGEFCEEHTPYNKKLKLKNDIIAQLEAMQDDSDNALLEEAMHYFCSLFDIREGYKEAIELTLDDQCHNHIGELDINDLIKLKNKLTNIKPELSPIQLEAIKNPCPHCLTGVLYAVSGEGEQLLYCNHCLLSMDSDGGMIS